ncbi:MAG TPA: nitroreductase family protein [Opitutales bacterium]|nr:nitroreductase family protein [Opitutales bacterium]
MSEISRITLSALDAIEARRAIKHFDPEFTLSKDEIEKLAALAAKAPTSFNIQHYRFVAVTDKALKAQLQEAAYGQPQVVEASVVFIIASDLKAWSRDPARYWRNTPPMVQEQLVQAITGYYEGRDETQRDDALLSAGMAAQTLMLAAKALGYDSCPMRGFDFARVAKLVNLPADHVIAMMIAIGRGTEPAHVRPGPLPLSELLKINHF